MENLYPDYFDKEGFLFYPIDGLITHKPKFENIQFNNFNMKNKQCVIFADYMSACWWYGIIIDDYSPMYSVVEIPNPGEFKVLTDSFSKFLDYYIQDDPILYLK